VLATGGTAEDLAKSLEAQKIVVNGKEYGVKVKEFVFIVEIADLKGKERLESIAPVRSITEI
jgi:adenine/guanine phosphoribosyltransferase-like PRPP-binding protein